MTRRRRFRALPPASSCRLDLMSATRGAASGDLAPKQVERGFTLLELLLTLSVTTIGLIGLMALHLSIARGNDMSNRTAEASSIANGLLEQLRAARASDMVFQITGNASDTPPIDQDMGPVTGRANMPFGRRVLVTSLPNASTNLWLVRVEIGWTEDGAAQSANRGALDHTIAVEVVRTVEDEL
jgi:prepilin-type N-terminal cleavage/methylation domain-containing protein